MITEVERIAKIFKLKADDEYLVLKVGDIVKAKDKESKKKDFCNYVLKAQNDKLKKEINNLHNEFAESIGITEHMMIKQSRDVLKKELNKALEEKHKLNETIRKYKEREFKDRLKSIAK